MMLPFAAVIYNRWISPGWYRYLLRRPADGWSFHNIRVALYCRLRGHPAGPVWNSSGLEPDMSCRNCGDDMG